MTSMSETGNKDWTALLMQEGVEEGTELGHEKGQGLDFRKVKSLL